MNTGKVQYNQITENGLRFLEVGFKAMATRKQTNSTLTAQHQALLTYYGKNGTPKEAL
jgi:hypothetical protein